MATSTDLTVTIDQVTRILDLALEGKSIPQISAATQLPLGAVTNIVRDAGGPSVEALTRSRDFVTQGYELRRPANPLAGEISISCVRDTIDARDTAKGVTETAAEVAPKPADAAEQSELIPLAALFEDHLRSVESLSKLVATICYDNLTNRAVALAGDFRKLCQEAVETIRVRRADLVAELEGLDARRSRIVALIGEVR